jgi:SAM-dependent methyltransferase
MTFKDHFSGHASLYAQARPHYPDALFDWVADTAPSRECAWDVGCGNGQASVALAQRFDRVIATDPSAQQIGNAQQHPRIDYRVESGERTSIPGHSVDAITVAQALHWFDLPRFVEEVQRVAKPGALFAAWTYAGCNVTPQVDTVIARLYEDTLGAYWPPERRLVDEGYASLALPFEPVQAPAFEMRMEWNAEQLLAYLSSWSAAQRHRAATGRDAVAEIADALRNAWGDPRQSRAVRWNLGMRAGKILQERACARTRTPGQG